MDENDFKRSRGVIKMGITILVVANIATAVIAARAMRREDAEYEARLVAQHDANRLALEVAQGEADAEELTAQLVAQRELTERVQASWERCEERAQP